MSKNTRKQSTVSRHLLNEETVNGLSETMEELDSIAEEYCALKSIDPLHVDELRRVFLSYYATYSHYMSAVYSKKGPNHIYLEDLRKQVRQEHVDFLVKENMDPKYSVTRAEKDIDSNHLCVRDMEALENFRRILFEYEKRDKFYQMILTSMSQSIAITRKDIEAQTFVPN